MLLALAFFRQKLFGYSVININEMRIIVPDFSVLVNQKLLGFFDEIKDDSEGFVLLLPGTLISLLEDLSEKNDPSGILALNHLTMILKQEQAGHFEIQVRGMDEYPKDITSSEACRRLAQDEDGLYLTCDPVQEVLAQLAGISVHFIDVHEAFSIDDLFGIYFDDETMSVHLVEGQVPRGKKGRPGSWELINVG
ncbi:MAG: hypothetical protein ACTSXU_01805, partial [Promethearchaeota archaeon]